MHACGYDAFCEKLLDEAEYLPNFERFRQKVRVLEKTRSPAVPYGVVPGENENSCPVIHWA